MNSKKELKQQYKDSPRDMGVYRVLNLEDGLSLVGVANDVNARLNRHRVELRFGGHRNKALQADWNRLGEEKFTFQVVELLEPLEVPDYDAAADLEDLLALTLELEEYSPLKIYNGRK